MSSVASFSQAAAALTAGTGAGLGLGLPVALAPGGHLGGDRGPAVLAVAEFGGRLGG
jgi:hypothetical protein